MVTQKDWILTFETCKRNFCESRARARVCVDKSISKSVKDAMQKNNNPNERVETEVFLCSDRFPTQPALRARDRKKTAASERKRRRQRKEEEKVLLFFSRFPSLMKLPNPSQTLKPSRASGWMRNELARGDTMEKFRTSCRKFAVQRRRKKTSH